MVIVLGLPLFRKILAPIKIKSALAPPPPKPPLKRGILWTWVFLQKERIFPGVHKIGAAISGPRIADTNFTDTRIFLTYDKSLAIAFVCGRRSEKTLRFLQQKGFEPACGHRGHCDFVRSDKLQNESSPNFLNFRPEYCPEFCSDFFSIFFEEFSCFVSQETDARKNSPKIPAIFQCKIPTQIRRKNPQKFSGEQAK